MSGLECVGRGIHRPHRPGSSKYASDWHPPAQISPYGHGDTAFKVLDVLCVLESAN